MLPTNLLTEVPSAIAQQLSPAIAPALAGLAGAAIPAASTAWRSVADSVDRNWGDGARSGAGAAGTSLKQAANAAADLEARAGTIDSDIAKGLAAVMSAATDLARIAMDFVTSAMGSLTATAAGPAGLAATGASLVSAASSSISQAIARLMKLEQELRPLVQSLIQQASTAVDTPAPPRPTQLEAPSRLRFYVYEHPRIGQRYRRCRWFVGVVRFGRRAGACGCGGWRADTRSPSCGESCTQCRGNALWLGRKYSGAGARLFRLDALGLRASWC